MSSCNVYYFLLFFLRFGNDTPKPTKFLIRISKFVFIMFYYRNINNFLEYIK